jgi:ADP-heptose:LPS heptosyltransferase
MTGIPDLTAMRRLLIVKLSSLGDLVHALPVAAALKDAFPHLEISWAAHPAFAPVVEHSPVLHEVLAIPRARGLGPAEMRPLIAAWRRVRGRGFDVVLDLHGLSKSAFVVLASGSRYRFGWDTLREIAPVASRRIPRRSSSLHVVDQLLDVAHFLGADVRQPRFPIATAPEDEAAATAALQEAGIDPGAAYLVLNPTSGGGGRKGVAAGVMVDALDRISGQVGLPVVLVGTGGDLDVARAVEQGVQAARVYSLIGRTRLGTLKAVIRRAAGHMGADTGSSHLAAAFDVPTVSWFGRTDPARSAPYGGRSVVVHHRDQCVAACLARRTDINSPQRCVLAEPACLPMISGAEIAAAAARAFSPARSPAPNTRMA